MLKARLLKELPKNYKKSANQLLFALITAIADALKLFDDEFKLALIHANILTAQGFWLNYWGFYFGIDRFPGESDTSYRRRIVVVIKYGSNNRDAILGIAKSFSLIEPVLTEYTGEILFNADYSALDLTSHIYTDAFIMRLEYRPASKTEQTSYIDEAYIDHDIYLAGESSNQYVLTEIEGMIKAHKTAGIKLIFKIV